MRTIDADELDVYLEKRMVYEAHRNHAYLKGVRDCRKDLANTPTIEAEPIVRCEKCTWYLEYEDDEMLNLMPFCNHPTGGGVTRGRQWYCADGE